MQNVGIIVNHSKDKGLKICNHIVNWLESNNKHVMLTEITASMIGKNEYGFIAEEIYSKADFVIVLGGDGTILKTARDSAEYQTPILGINLGHLGFLAEVNLEDIDTSLETIFKEDKKIEKRMMLQASIYKDNSCRNFYALNDIVISRDTLSRIITMDTYINDDYVYTVSGDGLIIASPTGSTGYTLAAGGPIISPNLSVIAMTPICSHTLNSRSILFSGDESVKIDFEHNRGDAYLTIDGQHGFKIEKGEQVIIKKAPYTTNLIKLPGRSFYKVLRTKLTER